ncbi:MAG: galactokinase, partial [Chloroflexi bacterium]|nr:galactokinase [Chloroflexota bacterium]
MLVGLIQSRWMERLDMANASPLLDTLQSQFSNLYRAPPSFIARAPGRVNLIGEHTDYNDGFVLPIALDRAVYLAARPRADRTVRVVARDFAGARAEFSLDAITRDDKSAWSNYLRGVAWALEQRGARLRGCDLVIAGDVPIGAGLSSSAALEVAAAMALCVGAGLVPVRLSRVEIARVCQRAENEFVGVQSGIMDQFVSALARAGHALRLDCRDLTYEYVPIPRSVSIVVCNSMKSRGLVESAYNERQAECDAAAQRLGELLGKPVKALRDISLAELESKAKELTGTLARRARHVISENQRVLDAVRNMRENKAAAMGALMNASHASLRDDFEVCCDELDALVEIAIAQYGCWGARLTGAGFGGCTVN